MWDDHKQDYWKGKEKKKDGNAMVLMGAGGAFVLAIVLWFVFASGGNGEDAAAVRILASLHLYIYPLYL